MFQKCQGFRFIIDNKVYDPRYERNFLIREIVQFLIEWQGYVPIDITSLLIKMEVKVYNLKYNIASNQTDESVTDTDVGCFLCVPVG